MIMKETMIDAYRDFQEDLERTLPKKSETPYQDVIVLIATLVGLLITGIILGSAIVFGFITILSGVPYTFSLEIWHAYLILIMIICMVIVTVYEVRNNEKH